MFLGDVEMRELLCLDALNVNECGFVFDINCCDEVKKRLLDLGLVRDTLVVPVLNSPFGGIRAFDVRGALIAIRDEDCALINIYKK